MNAIILQSTPSGSDTLGLLSCMPKSLVFHFYCIVYIHFEFFRTKSKFCDPVSLLAKSKLRKLSQCMW